MEGDYRRRAEFDDTGERWTIVYITEEMIRRAPKTVAGTKLTMLNLSPRHEGERIQVSSSGWTHFESQSWIVYRKS